MHLSKRIVFTALLLYSCFSMAKIDSDEVYELLRQAANKTLQLAHYQRFYPKTGPSEVTLLAFNKQSTPTIHVYVEGVRTFKLESHYLQTLASVTAIEGIGNKPFLLAFILAHGVHGQRFLLVEPQSGDIFVEQTSDWGIKLHINQKNLWFTIMQDKQKKRIEWPKHP